MSDETTYQQLTFYAGDSPAKMSALLDAGRDWMESAADFGSSSIALLESLSRAGWSSKTYPAFYPATEGEILPPSFEGWQSAGMVCAGGYLMLSISDSPNDASVCSLSEVLETEAPQKYYLSATAAAGILRRAEKRGKTLPTHLEQALRTAATREMAD